MFGWGRRAAPRSGQRAAAGKRHQELDVYPLHTLRGLAQHEMGAVRRSGTSLVLTKTGRLMADDAAVRWHIGTAALIGPDDGPDPDFTVAVREAALLITTLHDGPVGYEELTSRLTELHASRRVDVPVGQQPGRRDPRRDTRATAPAARPAAARRADGRGTRASR